MSDSAYLSALASYVLARKSHSVFEERQAEALKNLLARGLPTSTDEAYCRTPFARKLQAAVPYALRKGAPPPKSHFSPLPFAKESTYLPFSNNILLIDAPSQSAPVDGLHVSTLSEAFESHPRAVEHAFTSPLRTEDPFTMLNEAAFEHATFIYVAPGASIDKPLVLHQHAHSDQEICVSHPRTFIYVDKGAKLTIIDAQTSAGATVSHQNSVSEIVLKEQAALNYYKMQHDTPSHLRIDHTYVALSAKAQLQSYVFSSGAALLRNNLSIDLLQTGAKATLKGLYMPDARSHIDNHSTVVHSAPQTYSDQCYKGVLGEQGRGVFNGCIIMRANSAQSEAYQTNKNLLLSAKAKIHSKPQLEIHEHDVRCSHGCTVGQLSEDERFYLQSRGISKSEANRLLLSAFVSDVQALGAPKSAAHYLSDWQAEYFYGIAK